MKLILLKKIEVLTEKLDKKQEELINNKKIFGPRI